MKDKVSIIIPVYNAGKYLRECIDSVLYQTYNNIEIVAINDGSTDNSKEILEEYASKYANIKVFHTENRGVCAARNTGLDNADGEYIMFVDADDYLMEDAVRYMCDILMRYNADLVIGNQNQLTQLESEMQVWEKKQAIEKALLDDAASYAVWGKLYKREKIEDIFFIEGRKIHEDSYFVFQCFLKELRVVVINKNLYRYRDNEESASHAAFSEKYFDILYFAEEKWKIIEERYPELLDKAKNMLVKANIAMLQCLLNTKDKKYDENVKECIATVKRYKKYFIPNYPGDKQRFFIIVNNLYGVYKWLYQLKYAKRIKKA